MNDNSYSQGNKRQLIVQFEKVMSCIRYNTMGPQEMFEETPDNIETLVNMTDAQNIAVEMKTLFDEFLNILNLDNLMIEIKSSDYKISAFGEFKIMFKNSFTILK